MAAARFAFRTPAQHGCLLSARVAVDAIERLHVIGFPIPRFLLLRVIFSGHRVAGDERRSRCGRSTGAKRAAKVATSACGLLFRFSRRLLPSSPPAVTKAARTPRFRFP